MQKVLIESDSIGTQYYKLISDTIISGIKYFKLYSSNDLNNWKIKALLNEDSTDQKIFCDGTLIYDFKLKIRDTIIINVFELVVDTIDSIRIGSNNYKRIRLNNYFFKRIDWIEGIGASIGPISIMNRFGDMCQTDYIDTLLCFYNNDTLIYQTNNFCFYKTNYLKINNIEKQVQYLISPNPIKDYFTIKSQNNDQYFINIYNNQGQMVFSQKAHDQYIQINIQSLKSGIYFIRLTNQNQTEVFKIIKK